MARELNKMGKNYRYIHIFWLKSLSTDRKTRYCRQQQKRHDPRQYSCQFTAQDRVCFVVYHILPFCKDWSKHLCVAVVLSHFIELPSHILYSLASWRNCTCCPSSSTVKFSWDFLWVELEPWRHLFMLFSHMLK